MYRFPEPRPTRDRWMTYASPLCSPARDRFVDVLSLCLPLLPPAPSRLLLKRHSGGALGEYRGSMREYGGAASEHREAVYGCT